MAERELKNVPPLYGWTIATAAGAVAFGASLVAVGIEGNGSVAIGVVVALVVGLIFTIAENPPAPLHDRAEISRPPVVATPAPTVPADPAPGSSASPTTAPAMVAETTSTAPAEDRSEAAVEAETGTKPQVLSAPQGTADDLKLIGGIGPVLEGKLNDLGIFHFWQIAGWTEREVVWMDGYLSFKGRIARDNWIAKAAELAAIDPARKPEG